jgi:amino acid transporter/mannitol/fructose-specific phosphotransferase system IIA component (Ntr-type)
MAVLSKSKQLKKELSLFNIYTIATGATIASGFFLLPGLAFSQAGPAMVLSYIIAAIPVIPALFSMAELSTAMPRAGGVYFFLDRSMGPLMGTVGGIGTWLALVLKTSFALIGIGAYLSLFVEQIDTLPLAIGFAVIFGIINLLGAKRSGMFQTILVVGLLMLLGWFCATGIGNINLQIFTGFFKEKHSSIFATAGLVYVSYIGLSNIASVSEEVKDPEKNIPRAMFLALATAMSFYAIGTAVMVGIVPAEQLRNNLTPVATTAEIITGRWGSVIMTVAAILAFFSVANAGILGCSRYPLAMSRDHLLPTFFRHLTKHKTPINSIFATIFLIISVLIIFDPTKIAKLAGAFQLLLFCMISLAVIVMRESHIASYDPGFNSPLYPWMQIFGMIAPIWLIVEMGWLPSLFSLGLILVGLLWYIYFAKKKVARDGAIYHIFARLGQRRFEGLDSELRSILKEKGLRDQDPFDAVVASANFIDIQQQVSFEEIVEQASVLLSKQVRVDSKLLKRTFMEGTQVGATPVSHGVALPHLRLNEIEHSELIIVRCKKGVFINIESDLIGGQLSNEAIFALLFLVSPEENPGQHLRILAQIASHVDDENFISNWLSANNEQELKELLLREDRYLSLLLKTGSKTATLIGSEIRNLNLPEGSLIALIHRQGEIIVPKGKTILKENDRLTIISYPKGIQELYDNYLGG